MTTSERTRDRGQRQARRLLQQLGTELRDARLAAGVSQRHVAHVAGLSQARISRTESAQRLAVRVDELAMHCAALGLRLVIKAYPEASPVRDAGQLRLLERLRRNVHSTLSWTAEAPISGYGDLRAWDVRLDGPGSIGVDAETRLHDIQALQRRISTKRRDSGVDRVILLVAATRHNRSVLREHRAALVSSFPTDSTGVLASLRQGRLPEADGIVLL